MPHSTRHTATIQPGGRIELTTTDAPPGTEIEIILILPTPPAPALDNLHPALRALVGVAANPPENPIADYHRHALQKHSPSTP